MEISSLFIRVLFLAFPGILGSRVYRKLRGRSKKKTWEDFTEILIVAVASYLFYALLLLLIRYIAGLIQPLTHFATSRPSSTIFVEVLSPLWDDAREFDPAVILWASMCGVFLAFVGAKAHYRSWMSRVAHLTRVSNRIGDEDLWTFLFNSPDLGWCFVRDHHVGLVYYGWIRAWSEAGNRRGAGDAQCGYLYEHNGRKTVHRARALRFTISI